MEKIYRRIHTDYTIANTDDNTIFLKPNLFMQHFVSTTDYKAVYHLEMVINK